MSIIRKWITLLLVAWLYACSQGADAPTHPHDVPIMGTDGEQHTLNDYIGKGQWVVVNVWATRCPYCVHELFDLDAFYARHYLDEGAPKDAFVLGLTTRLHDFAMPDADRVAQFKEDYLIEFPLLLVDQPLAELVLGKPIAMVPISFFYNPTGKLVYQINGMVDEDILEAVITRKSDAFKMVWAKEMPPEYKP